MNIKKVLTSIFLALGIVIQFAQAAVLTIQNTCPYTLYVHPVLSVQDEYVTQFKYAIPAGKSVSYNSGIYPILGVRWKKVMTHKDGTARLESNYLTTDMPKVSVTNTNALIKIDDKNNYHYLSNKKANEIESKGTLIAVNYYERFTDGTVRKFTGLAREIAQKLQNKYGKNFVLKGDYIDEKSDGFSDWLVMK